MAEIEEDKKTRKGKKSVVTRHITAIEKFIAEDDVDEVYDVLGKLKSSFKEFEDSHYKFHDQLEDDVPQAESEKYFLEVQSTYIAALNGAKKWLKANGVTVEVKNTKVKLATQVSSDVNDPSVNPEDLVQTASSAQTEQASASVKREDKPDNINYSELVSVINLPNLELVTFSGDPMDYHSFMAAFDEHVGSTNLLPGRKLSRLVQYTDHNARKAIKPCQAIGGQEGYEQAREILERRFGNDYLVSETIIKSVKNGKPVRSPEEMQSLADELTNCHLTLKNMKRLEEIDSQTFIVSILERLQPYVRNRWKRQALERKREHGRYPGFDDFVKFIIKEADEATDPVYGNVSASNKSNRSGNTGTSFSTQAKIKFPCKACNQDHNLFSCPSFKAMNPLERLNFVRQHKLCENCLYSNHKTSDCRKPSVCSVPGCGQKHTKYIHVDPSRNYNSSSGSSSQRHTTANVTDAVSHLNEGKEEFHVPIVPIEVNDKCKVNALLDTASTNTFCSQRLVDLLGVQGRMTSYTLTTLTSKNENKDTLLVDLSVKSLDGSNSLDLRNVYVVPEIPVRLPRVDTRQYSHLHGLPLGSVGLHVDILIGQDHSSALVPLETRKGLLVEPFAVRTILGWSLNGPAMTGGAVGKKVVNHFVNASLDQKVEQLWHIENDNVGETLCYSPQDEQVLKLWDNEVKVENEHYVLPIPWKNDITVPNNMCVAISRLKSLRKSLVKKCLLSRYDDEILKLVQKGYAETVPINALVNSDVWYLPHQAVVTDKKPGKVRVVFDCSAKFMGESLNDKCLQGPDLNNKLQHVLLRFRRHEFAVTADIEAMYNQVRIPEHHRDYLRFLWMDENQDIIQYRMTSHLFGGVWCASAATYALRKTVEDEYDVSELVRDTVMHSFYVDDCLQSVPSRQEAADVIQGTKDVLMKRGFNLTKFVTNDESLLLKIPEANCSGVKDLHHDKTSKVLGVKWNTQSDCLYFDIDNINCNAITKRSMLSILSSTFDPLGVLSPILIVGKILFQEVTRLKIGWDDAISDEIYNKWCHWVKDLENIKLVMPASKLMVYVAICDVSTKMAKLIQLYCTVKVVLLLSRQPPFRNLNSKQLY